MPAVKPSDRKLAALLAVLIIAGCGGSGDAAPTPAPTPAERPQAAQARELVYFQRQGAGGATLDTISVRADGTATLARRYGGAGGRFRELELKPGVMPRLRAALRRLPPRRPNLLAGSPRPGRAQYLMRYRGRTLTAIAGAVVPRGRRAVALLDGLIDGIGVRAVTRERATGTQ